VSLSSTNSQTYKLFYFKNDYNNFKIKKNIILLRHILLKLYIKSLYLKIEINFLYNLNIKICMFFNLLFSIFHLLRLKWSNTVQELPFLLIHLEYDLG